MAKPRSHNEWFRTVSLGGRKSCPTCSAKLPPGESVWSWGEYVRAKWRTITHFCVGCAKARVLDRLTAHTDDCGCTVNLCGRGERLPDWLKLPETCGAKHGPESSAA
jgi:hypothetical protein